jgi:hypothetical protein
MRRAAISLGQTLFLILLALAVTSKTGLAAETISTASPCCGFTPAVTAQQYFGRVEVTVSGNVFFVPPNGEYDAFYVNTPSGPTDFDPSPLRIARYGTGSPCTCPVDCPGRSFPASDILVGAYPAYNPLHTYTVVLDLGPVPDRIAFGIPDCGCWDNSGGWTATIKQLSSFPSFAVNKASVTFGSTTDSSHIEGQFNVSTGMSVDPRTQEVSFEIGSVAVVIPPGSFVLQRGVYRFSGSLNGVQVVMEIAAAKGGGYRFFADVAAVDMTGTTNPVEFEFRLGEEYGITDVKLLGTLSVGSGKQ